MDHSSRARSRQVMRRTPRPDCASLARACRDFGCLSLAVNPYMRCGCRAEAAAATAKLANIENRNV